MLKPLTFGNPGYLILLLVIPLLVVWYFYRSKKQTADLQMSSTEGFAQVGRNLKFYVYHSLYVLRLLAVTLLIIALARPQTSLSRQDISVEGIDLVIALDVSGSMLAMDFKPDRLEAAKDLAIEFIDGRPNDRIGLVIFSGETFTQCPLTTDHAVLKNLFRDIHSGMIDDGTALGDGLATAVNRLRGSKAISKVIILLTDGVNNMGSLDPRSAAEIAKLYGIRIYTIGIGTLGTAPYPFQTQFGIHYENMPVEIDEPLLKQIADLTGGNYYRATGNTSLREIYKTIDKLEKARIEISSFRKFTDKFLVFALLSALFLLLEFTLKHTVFRRLP